MNIEKGGLRYAFSSPIVDRMPPSLSAGALRSEISARNLVRSARLPHELSISSRPSVVYQALDEEDHGVGHGNFLPSAWRAIQARPEWRRRLDKVYTGSARLPRRHDRHRGELECAASSDALLMNLFCSPGWLRRRAVAGALGVPAGSVPRFGVRANLPMANGEVDRTEIDLQIADLMIEAKLTEGGFGTASSQRLLRYDGVEELFDAERLPRTPRGEFAGYQLIRGALAASTTGARFMVLADARRADLAETWFRVAAATRSADARCRLRLVTWQELARASPTVLQRFLAEKYGIDPIVSREVTIAG